MVEVRNPTTFVAVHDLLHQPEHLFVAFLVGPVEHGFSAPELVQLLLRPVGVRATNAQRTAAIVRGLVRVLVPMRACLGVRTRLNNNEQR